MNKMLLRNLFFLLLFVGIFSFGKAQTSESAKDMNLHDQFKTMVDKSETYNDYKVIKQSKLTEFMGLIKDSISVLNRSKKDAYAKIVSQETKLEALNTAILEKDEIIANNDEEKSTISVLGMRMNKLSYSIISLILPLLLLIIIGGLVVKLQHNNRVTNQARADLERVEKEYESHKRNTLETQMKLKRELQTERNKLLEFKK